MAVCLLGFGITGFIELADSGGASLLDFQFNPLQNILHGLIGGLAMTAALRWSKWSLPVTLVGGALFVLGGWIEMGDAETILGMNDLTSVAHLGAGVLTLLGGMAVVLGSEDPKDGPTGAALIRDNGN